MAEEHFRHIYLAGPTYSQGFTNPRRGGPEVRTPARYRGHHSAYLRERLQQAWREAEAQLAVLHVERKGVNIEFESEPGFDLAIQSLERISSGIRLLNVRKQGTGSSERTFATVYVPNDRRGYFLKKIQDYSQKNVKSSNKPLNAKLIESISDIRRAVLKSFWRTGEYRFIPRDNPEWVEVWLSSDRDESIAQFETLLRNLNLETGVGILLFPERSVKLVRANRNQLERLVETSDDIAELRAAKEVATYFVELTNTEQVELVQGLLNRTEFNDDEEVAVCILDSGVNNGHALINPILDAPDLHAVDPSWGNNDHNGHGTLMAGMVAYGDLLAIFNSAGPIRVNHRLESAKILPPPPETNPKKLWGYMTAQGIHRAEIQAPHRKRITCMAVTSTEDRDRGRPSSWSAAVDELTSGYSDDARRLFIVSAGNVDNPISWLNYPADNLTNQIHDPGQAWNALTVGAFTEKTRITDTTLHDYIPVAPPGGLSPYSTTSTTWALRKWPIKPEVVFEGGNVARGPNSSLLNPDDLQLLSTYRDPQVAQFAPFSATSASSAQAALMAAQIQVQYPDAWPETIRALIVHTAEWTDTMKSQFLRASVPSRQAYARLLRICGYGVPDLDRALYCAANSLTLISQAVLQPYDKNEGRYVTRDMHLYNLPWPSEVLEELGSIQVKMRITLSYFIEPGPGEVGWDSRYRYPSHALRFVVNGPGETEHEFIRRVNIQARDEDEPHPGTEGPGDKWLIGDARNVGSIHSDIWQGTAADLATSNLIAIYPAVGWWRERHHLERWNKSCRYSLIISINTPDQTVDIYTPVAAQVRVTTPITIDIGRRSSTR